MFSKFPPTGNFNGISLHEMLLQLIESRFSGSLEITSDDAVRTFHFDKGLLCAASSNASEEQLDGLLEREKSQSLHAEQMIEIEERRKKGQSFGQAVVDSGFIPATELLEFSSKMAEIIFMKALSGSARSYRLDQGRSFKYHPLPFDPLVVLFQSIVNDISPELVKEKLGNENKSYTRTVTYFSAVSGLRDNPEIIQVIDQLDGKRTVKEIINDLEINPARTAGIFLFLKWMDWIESASAESVGNIDESPLVMARAGTNFVTETTSKNLEPEFEEPLDLMMEEDEIIEDFSDSSSETGSLTESEAGKKLHETFGKLLDEEVETISDTQTEANDRRKQQAGQTGFMQKKSGGNFVFRILIPALGGLAIIIIVALVMFSSSPSSSQPAAQSNSIEAKPSIADEKPQSPVETTHTETVNTNNSVESNQVIQPATDGKKDQTSNGTQKLSFSGIQPQALHNCAIGKWTEAVKIWKQQINTGSNQGYTILITSVNKGAYLESVFERIANSAKLRNNFFILEKKQNNSQLFFACWGIFKDLTSAKAAVNTLSESIRRLYKPGVKSLAELMR